MDLRPGEDVVLGIRGGEDGGVFGIDVLEEGRAGGGRRTNVYRPVGRGGGRRRRKKRR